MSNEVTNYDKAWADQASAYAAQEKLTGGTFISLKGGNLSIGDEVMPGNQMAVIVLDAIAENTLYENTLKQMAYDPNDNSPPLCYAFGRTAEEMAPHESMQADLEYFQPQSESCGKCPHNQWGSAHVGRGKMCQNRRRLALIPAGFYQPRRGSKDMDLELFTDPKHFQTADMAFLKLPPTSVGAWSKYVNQIAANNHRPPHGVVTRIAVEPNTDGKSNAQYVVTFEMIEEVSADLAAAVMARHDQAIGQVIQGYTVPTEKPVQAPVANGLRGLRSGARR